LERGVWVVAFVNAGIALGTALAFARTMPEAIGAATIAGFAGFSTVRMLVASAWYDTNEAYKKSLSDMQAKVSAAESKDGWTQAINAVNATGKVTVIHDGVHVLSLTINP